MAEVITQSVTLPSDAPRWRAPEDATAADRVAWLDELGTRGATDPVVVEFVRRSSVELVTGGTVDPCDRVLKLAHAVAAMCTYDDPPSGDYYQTARETLESLRGDCKAFVVFELAAARILNVRARACWLFVRGARFDHASGQLARGPGAPWRWADPLFVGARLGEHPFTAAERLAGLEVR